MSDIIDDANETADLHLQVALRNYKQSGTMQPAAVAQGFCLHCGVELPPPLLWCNAEHRDLWQEHYR